MKNEESMSQCLRQPKPARLTPDGTGRLVRMPRAPQCLQAGGTRFWEDGLENAVVPQATEWAILGPQQRSLDHLRPLGDGVGDSPVSAPSVLLKAGAYACVRACVLRACARVRVCLV